MPMIDREGTFKALPMAWAVQQKEPGKPPYWVCQFKIVEGQGDQGGWDDWSGYDFEITGYFYFIKNDRTPNTVTLNNLKDSFGWDGVDIPWLDTADLSKTLVQIVVKGELYNGQNKLKVAFVNPHDYAGGNGAVEKLDQSAVKTIAAQWGSVLRATGGAPQPRPAPSQRPPLQPTRPAH